MLETQGFKPKNWIDVFDAGPVMSANLFEIQVVKASRILEVESKIKVPNLPCFISNVSKNFRAIFADVPYDENKIELSSLQQKILKVSIGDKVRIWKGY
jgi:arginine N-succinyltransferase